MYAFLVEKQRRSGSLRTVQGYSSMLQDFFGRVSKAPDKVNVQEVFAWAHGKGVSGKNPSPVTAQNATSQSRRETPDNGIERTA